jgi:hypothetical protein
LCSLLCLFLLDGIQGVSRQVKQQDILIEYKAFVQYSTGTIHKAYIRERYKMMQYTRSIQDRDDTHVYIGQYDTDRYKTIQIQGKYNKVVYVRQVQDKDNAQRLYDTRQVDNTIKDIYTIKNFNTRQVQYTRLIQVQDKTIKYFI